MGLGAAMEIGKAGLKIYQVATEVISENIANVNTPGYSRQRAILESAPPTTHNGFPLGSGVKISIVERYYDALLQKQLVNAGTASGYDSAKLDVLQQIEPVFNEVATDGLGSSMDAFFNSWQDLASNPNGTAERQVVISKAQIMLDQFHYVDSSLNAAITAQEESITPQVNDINRIIKDISVWNAQINKTEQVYGNANEMRDQRDYAVRTLAEQIGIGYTENSDGTTDVYMTDDATGTDYYLVKGSQYGKLNATVTPPALTEVTVTDYLGVTGPNSLDPTSATPFYSSDTSGGQLWATLKMRDVTIPDYLAQVDELANQMATQVNAQHIDGFDQNDVAGVDFFTGTTAGAISLNITSPDKIAAASAIGEPGNNVNAIKLAQLASKSITFSVGASTFNGTYSNFYGSLVAQVGLDVQSAQTVVNQDAAFMKQLSNLRESSSGVSLDEELASLIEYQRAYQASAKLITTAGEMMDTVINMMG
jgi:flagellar hook-associated protein 1